MDIPVLRVKYSMYVLKHVKHESMTSYNYGLCTSTVQKINRELFPLVRPLKQTDVCFEDIVSTHYLPMAVLHRDSGKYCKHSCLNAEHLKGTIEHWPFLSVCRWKRVSSHWLTSHINKNAMLSIVLYVWVSVGVCLGLRKKETEWRIESLMESPRNRGQWRCDCVTHAYDTIR